MCRALAVDYSPSVRDLKIKISRDFSLEWICSRKNGEKRALDLKKRSWRGTPHKQGRAPQDIRWGLGVCGWYRPQCSQAYVELHTTGVAVVVVGRSGVLPEGADSFLLRG